MRAALPIISGDRTATTTSYQSATSQLRKPAQTAKGGRPRTRTITQSDREMVLRLRRKFVGVPGLTAVHIHEHLQRRHIRHISLDDVDEILNDGHCEAERLATFFEVAIEGTLQEAADLRARIREEREEN
mgnify:CR=1 FL=1